MTPRNVPTSTRVNRATGERGQVPRFAGVNSSRGNVSESESPLHASSTRRSIHPARSRIHPSSDSRSHCATEWSPMHSASAWPFRHRGCGRGTFRGAEVDGVVASDGRSGGNRFSWAGGRICLGAPMRGAYHPTGEHSATVSDGQCTGTWWPWWQTRHDVGRPRRDRLRHARRPGAPLRAGRSARSGPDRAPGFPSPRSSGIFSIYL